MLAQLEDSGVAIGNCSKGHRFALVHQCQKFELLFESGALALLDGYPREAVSSFAVALERLYEFYICIVARRRDIPPDILVAFLRRVHHSEPQFGAFAMLFLIETGTVFDRLTRTVSLNGKSATLVEARNKIIHGGVTPTLNDAVAYGTAVLETMNFILEPLMASSDDHIRAFVSDEMRRKRLSVPKGLPSANQGSITFMIDVSHHPELDLTTSFSDRLQLLRTHISDLGRWEGNTLMATPRRAEHD